MSNKAKKKQESTTTELYYEVHCKNFIVNVHKGGKAKVLSGQAPPPPKPGGH